MSRKRRDWYEGQILHVMNRGINHEALFLDEEDFWKFLFCILDAAENYDFVLHAYCLMTNHFHFLIETGKTPIGVIMKVIEERYAKWFNRKYHRDGPVFRGRFTGLDVDTDEYFIQTSKYISLNPVKAGIVTSPEQYFWSSYGTMIGICNDKITVRGRTLTDYFADDVSKYREFVESKDMDEAYREKIVRGMKEPD